MNQTETILEELLAAIDNAEELERVIKRRSTSKGPFYRALAMATGELAEKLRIQADGLRTRKVSLDGAESKIEELLTQRDRLTHEVQNLTEQRDRYQFELEQIEKLTEFGIGQEEFDRLIDLIGRFSTGEGLTSADRVNQFFVTVQKYQQLASLDLETTRAQNRLKQLQAEAQRAEVETNLRETKLGVRKEAIDATQILLEQGIPADDILEWKAILDTARTPTRTLRRDLEAYAGLQAAITGLKRERTKLQRQRETLERGIRTLRKRRTKIDDGLDAIAESGLKRVRHAKDEAGQAVQEVEKQTIGTISALQKVIEDRLKAVENRVITALDRYEDVSQEAAGMEQDVRFARALRQNTADDWAVVSPEVWEYVLERFVFWADVLGLEHPISIPEEVKPMASGSLDYPRLYGEMSLPLPALVSWIYRGFAEHRTRLVGESLKN